MGLRQFILHNHWGWEATKKLVTSTWLHNSLVYRWLYRRRIRRQVAGFEKPLGLSIETTNACNAHCRMCARKGMKRKVGFMSTELYEKLVREAREMGIASVGLWLFGEPLLDGQIVERVAIAKECGRSVGLFSNGQLLTEDLARGLIGAGLDRIAFSIDGIRRETYESIRRGLSYDTVYENVRRMGVLKGSGKRPWIEIACIRMNENGNELRALRRFWTAQQGIDRVIVADMRDWAGTGCDETTELGRFQKPELWLPPCRQLWQNINVLWDGRAIACCDDAANAELVIGDANQETLYDISRGGRLRELRSLHLGGRADEIPGCAKCGRFTVWW